MFAPINLDNVLYNFNKEILHRPLFRYKNGKVNMLEIMFYPGHIFAIYNANNDTFNWSNLLLYVYPSYFIGLIRLVRKYDNVRNDNPNIYLIINYILDELLLNKTFELLNFNISISSNDNGKIHNIFTLFCKEMFKYTVDNLDKMYDIYTKLINIGFEDNELIGGEYTKDFIDKLNNFWTKVEPTFVRPYKSKYTFID